MIWDQCWQIRPFVTAELILGMETAGLGGFSACKCVLQGEDVSMGIWMAAVGPAQISGENTRLQKPNTALINITKATCLIFGSS